MTNIMGVVTTIPKQHIMQNNTQGLAVLYTRTIESNYVGMIQHGHSICFPEDLTL